jgi:two-component system, NarL family, sensor histidine kinase UhpB
MEKPLRVLIIEDSEDDALLLQRQLQRDGYIPIYERVDTAGKAMASLENGKWDIIISDYILPQFSGLEALRIIRDKGLDIPCIIVSGRISEETAVAAMKAGAKDYIMKDNLKRLGPAIERELHDAQTRRESRKAQEAFKQDEAKLKLILNQMPCVLWATDENLRITSSLGAGLKALDLRPNQIVGMTIPQYYRTNNPRFIPILAHQQALEGRASAYELNWEGRILYCYVEPLHDLADNVIGVIGSAFDVTDKEHAEEELRALSHRLVDTQESERRQIARELHDEIGQSLTVIKLLMNQAAHSPAEKSRHILNEAQSVVTELIQKVREMSLKLRPSMLDDLGLLPTLLWYVERYHTQTRIEVKFEHSGLEKKFAPDLNTAVYRIIQEALTNVARYAKVNKVNVRINVENRTVIVQVEDFGCGFETAKLTAKSSTGLSGMRERAQLLGGNLKIQTSLGSGTKIIAELPISQAHDAE